MATFANLGRDAGLVAPCPLAAASSSSSSSSSASASGRLVDLGAYPHVAAFARFAPRAQVAALWRAVGAASLARLGLSGGVVPRGALGESSGPLWLSTSGLGVNWLHVRLDKAPKYYSFQPFKAWPRTSVRGQCHAEARPLPLSDHVLCSLCLGVGFC